MSASRRTSGAIAFDLFSPFLQTSPVDKRLLRALGIPADDYEGHLDKVLDPAEGSALDFYIEAPSGRRYFFAVKGPEAAFESCVDDEPHRKKAERYYLPHLNGLVDTRWLQPAEFFANYEVLSKLSYLGRYADSGMVFIFPKTDARLMVVDETIKKIVSKTLAPRVAILYLEYVVSRILTLVDDDDTLRRHFLHFQAKYIRGHALHSSAKAP